MIIVLLAELNHQGFIRAKLAPTSFILSKLQGYRLNSGANSGANPDGVNVPLVAILRVCVFAYKIL